MHVVADGRGDARPPKSNAKQLLPRMSNLAVVPALRDRRHMADHPFVPSTTVMKRSDR